MRGPTDSPFVLMTRLMTDVGGKLSAIDVDTLERPQQKTVALIKRLLTDCRLDIRDYELSETRDEQLRNATEASARLDQLRLHVLAASEHNLFSAIDIAQLSAQIDAISAEVV